MTTNITMKKESMETTRELPKRSLENGENGDHGQNAVGEFKRRRGNATSRPVVNGARMEDL